jgi:hypothetical protein
MGIQIRFIVRNIDIYFVWKIKHILCIFKPILTGLKRISVVDIIFGRILIIGVEMLK